MMTDPVADMLTRIRNANKALQDRVVMPSSKLKIEIARLLKEEGYLKDFHVERGESFDHLVVELKYGRSRERVITDLKRVSKPGRRVYARKDRLPRVLGGMGTAILSTSSGLVTDRTAAERGVGGEVIAFVLERVSRIGSQAIPVPAGVSIALDPARVMVNGPLDELSQQVPVRMTVERREDELVVTRPTDRGEDRALHGLTRSLIANMVEGVTKGFEKKLEIQGVGYRATLKGTSLELNVGYSHPVVIDPPEGISFEVPVPTQISVKGVDKQQVGETAAKIRKTRPPEPYKGKGIRYEGEYVRRKVGKRA